MADAIHQAIAAAQWPRALALALTAWRESHAPELADLVDAIATKCPHPITAKSKDVQSPSVAIEGRANGAHERQ